MNQHHNSKWTPLPWYVVVAVFGCLAILSRSFDVFESFAAKMGVAIAIGLLGAGVLWTIAFFMNAMWERRKE